jgi:hypothetical protein
MGTIGISTEETAEGNGVSNGKNANLRGQRRRFRYVVDGYFPIKRINEWFSGAA